MKSKKIKLTDKQKLKIAIDALKSIAAVHLEPLVIELFDSLHDVVLEDTLCAREALKQLGEYHVRSSK